MRLRPHRRSLVGPGPAAAAPAVRCGVTPLSRARRIYRFTRACALLAIFALMQLARAMRAGHCRCELERELAAFSTSAQRRDLQAALDRYPDTITRELRNILARQAMTAL